MNCVRVGFHSVCAMLIVLQHASAAIVFEQAPMPIGNPHVGSVGVASSDVDAIIQRSVAYDNFELPVTTTISGIEWSGAYADVFATDEAGRGTTDFLIEIFPNATENRPDVNSALASLTLNGGTSGLADGVDIQKTIIPDQLQEDGGSVVRYEANVTPFSLDAGTYWISIQSKQTITNALDPEWLWIFSDGGDKGFFSYDELFDPIGTQPGVAFPRDAAFTLLSSSAEVIGDYDGNGSLGAADIDLLSGGIRGGSTDDIYDLNNDGTVDFDDRAFWISDLFGTFQGDADLNREVAFLDFITLANNFGEMGGWADGDFTGDNNVLFNDFLALAQNFGKTAAAAGTNNSVPEPSGSSCALIGAFALIALLRRR